MLIVLINITEVLIIMIKKQIEVNKKRQQKMF